MSNRPAVYETVTLDHDGYSLTMRDRQICMDMTMRSLTKRTVKDIAESYGVSVEAIYKVTHKKDYKRFQKYLMEQVFEDMTQKAIVELDNMLEQSTSPSIKLKVIQTILSASGKMQNSHDVTVKVEQQETQLERERRILEMEKKLLED